MNLPTVFPAHANGQAPIAFSVPGLPVAQPRQRTRVVATGGRVFATNYTPKDAPVQSFKAAIRLAASAVYHGAPLTGPLAMTLYCFFPRSKSITWKNKPMPRIPKQGKPDVSNILKAVEDALNGLLYVDDAQLVRVVVEKWIAAGDEQPRCEISVEAI